uniref:Uncharacterized protein n=1 Tax=Leptobrachium leishanense TaxID=445787 RepID=A0A8C5QMW9_9ANUR
MAYKAGLNAPAHSPSTSMASSAPYRHLVNDYGPPSLGYTQGSNNNQVPQSKYAELLVIIEELGKEFDQPIGIIHARGLVRECLAETDELCLLALSCRK